MPNVTGSVSITGTPDVTGNLTVKAVPSSSSVLSLTDTTIDLTVLHSTTPVLTTDGCKNIEVAVTLSTATTVPALSLQGSNDNTNWYLISVLTTPVASSTILTQIASIPKMVRVIVATVGTVIANGYSVTIRAA